jgi:hypothetical protein
MLTTRTAATVIGVLFLAADAAGAAGLLMGGRLVSAPVDVAALQAHANRVVGAALLTLLMGVLLALIPIVGFPVFRRHDEVLATGYLVFRGALEMIGYAATAFVWLAMAQDTSLLASPGALNALARLPDAAINPYVDIVFSLGALMLCWLLLRARLVPGWLAIWGLAGGVLYLAQGAAAAFGSGWGPLMAPLALQEIVLAIWLIVKGFTEHIVADAGREREPQLSR